MDCLKFKKVIAVGKVKKIFSYHIPYTVHRAPCTFRPFTLFIFLFISSLCFGQDVSSDEPTIVLDTIKSMQVEEQQVEEQIEGQVEEEQQQVREALTNTILREQKSSYLPLSNDVLSDSTKRRYYWRITERTGEIVAGRPDTLITDFPNRQLVEGQGISMQYLGNLGLPAQSRIYFDRQERTNFMFTDNFNIYSKTPETFDFINTKIPYSNLSYMSAGSRQVKEERLSGGITVNFSKELNVGFNIDYLYARGYYQYQSAKHLNWIFYGSYISDRHRFHAFINPANQTNAENGGITDDLYITDPQAIAPRSIQSRDIPTFMKNTWNYIKSTRYYLNYHYNLGFEKETNKLDSLKNPIKQFIPVASIIYTFDYNEKFRRFNSNDTTNLDGLYKSREPFYYTHKPLKDSTSYWRLRNTFGLSMREGFNKWAKFDLTAFITQDVHNYITMAAPDDNPERRQSSTYIGGEIAKQKGKILRYNAHGDFGLLGHNLGDFNVSGNIETRIPILGDTASITGSAYIKNIAPTFYENTFRSKYFVWNNDFEKTKKVYFGGTLNIPHTKTNLSVGVENITNYIYFNKESVPEQYLGNIQVLAVSLEQNMRLGILNWNNQLIYQKSGDNNKLPLPDLSLYSNLFIQFKVAKVLTIQMGGNVNYFTEYYAPAYEPVTQQFRLQDEIKVGNYPLLNAYVNCHLKYTRFFIEFYNLSSSFINKPAYFSTPHYPVNPQVFKWGLSWDFNN